MAEAIIATLPMDSGRAQEFFLFTTPLVAHFISMATNQRLYLPINKLGETNIISDSNYKNGLHHLGIAPYTITYDNDPVFLDWMIKYITTKYKSDELFLAQKIIYRCICGAVEILSDATNKIEKRTNGKTFNITSKGSIECKKCNTIANNYSEPVLLTTPVQFQQTRIQVQPKLYTPIVEEHLSNFIEKSQLVSRTRETALHINIDGKRINIDNDFVWLHYGQYLQSKDKSIKGIISSNHSIRKGAIYAYLTTEKDENPDLSLFVTPYVSFKEKTVNLEMDILGNKYNSRTLRAFLLTHLNWQIQNTSADPNLLKWCARITKNLPISEFKISNFDNIVNLIKGHEFKKLAQVILKNGTLTEEQLKLLFILEPQSHHYEVLS